MNTSYSVMFWLNKSRLKNNLAAIYLRITITQKRLELSSYQYVNPDHWDKAKQKIKAKFPEAEAVNRLLDVMHADVHKHFSILSASNNVVTIPMLKNSYLGIKERQHTVCDAFDLLLRRYEERVNAKKIVPKTLTRLKITKAKVTGFMKHVYRVNDKPLIQIRLSFAADFEHYLTTVSNIGNNTAMKYLKITKQVFKVAVDNDWISNNPIGSFKCTYNQPIRERLTMKELMTIYNKSFSIKRLEQVKDVYVFCCFTGFAFLDVEQLTKENIELGIDNERWICKSRQKTKSVERVPLLPIAQEIIFKYWNDEQCLHANRLFPVTSNQKFNAYLKEIAELCGINKYLTSHSARHTFATTVTLENDVPIETVSQMLGHKSIRTTQIYAKITQTKVSNNMKALKDKLISLTANKRL